MVKHCHFNPPAQVDARTSVHLIARTASNGASKITPWRDAHLLITALTPKVTIVNVKLTDYYLAWFSNHFQENAKLQTSQKMKKTDIEIYKNLQRNMLLLIAID